MDYKPGDRIEVTGNNSGHTLCIGSTYVIRDIKRCCGPDDEVYVHWNNCYIRPEDFILVSQKDMMSDVNYLAEKNLSKELKTLQEIGWVDNSLRLTSTGQKVLLEFLMQSQMKDLGKLAQEEIDKRKSVKVEGMADSEF